MHHKERYVHMTGDTLPICIFCPEHCSVRNIWGYADEARWMLSSEDDSAVLSVIVRAFYNFIIYTKQVIMYTCTRLYAYIYIYT